MGRDLAPMLRRGGQLDSLQGRNLRNESERKLHVRSNPARSAGSASLRSPSLIFRLRPEINV